MELLKILEYHNPKQLSNGQIRTECPFRENHEGIYAASTGDGSKSFFISPNINSYHCFSCGAKGKLTKLLSSKFEVPFFEAVKYIRLEEEKIIKRKEFDLDIHWSIIPPKLFLDKGYRPETLIKFKVGQHRNKYLIPIIQKGKVVGVKYRVEEPERMFWYSDGFDRHLYLYNFKHYTDSVIVTEGETDVWRGEEFGYYTLGTFGTKVSNEQVDILKNFPIIYLAMDTDLPGIKATKYLYDMLCKHSEIRIINLPAKDLGACKKRPFVKAYENYCTYGEFKMLTGLK